MYYHPINYITMKLIQNNLNYIQKRLNESTIKYDLMKSLFFNIYF